MADPRIRQIKIKTGVVKRSKQRLFWTKDTLSNILTEDHQKLVKEKVMYVKETRQQEEKIERLKAEACDEEADSEAKYVIKKQLEVLQESKMMIPDCHRRLTIAHADLSQILETEEDLAEAEEYKEARTVLDSVKLEG
ncbi:tubulin-specific chaperone A isoform X1 [Salvelinus fontinalis]|uniref:tubulin-specific chaperone A isoform X1 n=1 Tax=Salvelinus fontinalis TaxID=8038 RepID=UPI002485252C|nr:tubulin-specific chaperone A isoform X1 [Salvelinus fontinalis]